MKGRWLNLFLVVALMLMMIIVGGCSGSDSNGAADSPGTTSDLSTEQDNGETPAVENGSTEDEKEDEKEDESKSSESWIKIESTNSAYENAEPLNWDNVSAQEASVSKYSNYSACFIYMANFETTEELKDVTLEEGQSVVFFILNLPPNSDPEVGLYDFFDTSGHYRAVQATIRLPGGTSINLNIASMTTAEIEITEVTDSTISGRFDIEDKWTKMSGEFQAPRR